MALRWITRILVAGVLLFCVDVSLHALSKHYTVPNFDDWRILDDFFSAPLVEWIVTPQNGHHVPVTLGLFALDYELFGGRQHLLVATGVLYVWLAVGALGIGVGPRSRLAAPLALAAFSFCAFILFWGAARHDLMWGFNQGPLMAAMWACFALVAFGISVERSRTEAIGSGTPWLLLAASCATAATFSQGIGYACWAGLLIAAVVSGTRPRVLIALAGAAIVVLLLFTSVTAGQEASGTGALAQYGQRAMKNPVRLLLRTLIFVGEPVSAIAAALGLLGGVARRTIAQWSGVVGVVLLAQMLVWCVLHRDRTTRRHVLSAGLAVSAVTAGLMIALNRGWLPDTELEVRFATWSSLFWAGLAAGMPTRIGSARGMLAGTSATLALALIAIAAWPALAFERAVQSDRRDHLAILRTLHLLDIQWDDLAGGTTFGANPARTYRVVARLREDRRSFFRDAIASLPGAVLPERGRAQQPDRCAGRVTSAQRIDARNGEALLLTGWAIDREQESPATSIVVVDGDGIVQGLGTPVSRTTPGPHETLPKREFPWVGFVRGSTCDGQHVAYALLEGGNAACRLGRVGEHIDPQCRSERPATNGPARQ